jgi:hypothetical protein
MANVLDHIPVDRITAEARQVHVGRTVLLVVAAVLYAVGWLAGKTLTVLWLALAWSGTAVKVGWTEARNPTGDRRGPA